MSRRMSRRAFLNAGATASTVLAACSHLPTVPDPRKPSPTLDCHDGETFHNWARTITCRPGRFCQPETQEEVAEIVKGALESGKRVRTVGGGHSWSPLVLTKDVLVNLDRMQEVTINPELRTATMQAGIRLKDLTPRLAQHGLGMANLGSIREQSIAGATATGTHGTGLGIGNLSTQIVGMKLVTGTGELLSITESDGDLLHAARVSLGALGIITEVTIQCVCDYALEYTAYWCKFDDILAKLDALIHENARVRLWWLVPPLGAKDHVILTTMNPPAAATGPKDDCRNPSGASPVGTGSPLPMDTEGLLKKSLPQTDASVGCPRLLHFTGNYVQVLTVPLLPVLHRECEYAVPAENAADALRAFKRGIEEGDLSLKLPVEVRFVAKDQSLLSPARGKDVCYIGVSTQDNATEAFERFEPIMKRLGGRPHWGKCFTLTRKDVEEMYPDSYETFRKIRRQLDPKGVFANELLQRLFD